jgi:hypothetical protein
MIAGATYKNFIYTEEEMILGTIAQRVEAKGFTFPTQSKYREK